MTNYSDYTDMVKSFCKEILVEVTDKDWQGDSRYLIQDSKGRYGFLTIGWGSCSACDALEACKTDAERESLRYSLLSSVKWFNSLEAAKIAIRKKDWEASCYRNAENERFKSEVESLQVAPKAMVPNPRDLEDLKAAWEESERGEGTSVDFDALDKWAEEADEP